MVVWGVIHRWLVPLIVTAHVVAASPIRPPTNNKKHHRPMTAKKSVKWAWMPSPLLDPELKTMFERDTWMRYEDVPNALMIRKSPVLPGS